MCHETNIIFNSVYFYRYFIVFFRKCVVVKKEKKKNNQYFVYFLHKVLGALSNKKSTLMKFLLITYYCNAASILTVSSFVRPNNFWSFFSPTYIFHSIGVNSCLSKIRVNRKCSFIS